MQARKNEGFDENGKLNVLKVYSNRGKLGQIASNMVLVLMKTKLVISGLPHLQD